MIVVQKIDCNYNHRMYRTLKRTFTLTTQMFVHVCDILCKNEDGWSRGSLDPHYLKIVQSQSFKLIYFIIWNEMDFENRNKQTNQTNKQTNIQTKNNNKQ